MERILPTCGQRLCMEIEETVDLNTISPVILIGEIYRPTVIRSVCAAELISDEDYVQVDFSSGQLHFYPKKYLRRQFS